MNIEPYERQVNYYETDQMGIVHHTNYFRYFEEARMDFMQKMNCSAMDLEKKGIIIPNVDAYARYLKILHFEDRFTIKITPASFTGIRMKFEYEVIKDGEVYCTGYTTHCFVDSDMKPIALKYSDPETYEKLLEIFDGQIKKVKKKG